LFATYQSYLLSDAISYSLEKKRDPRGTLAEILKAGGHGQLFISRTQAGITRGNHYHDTKVEKFLVLEGDALIRLRNLGTGEKAEYPVRGEEMKVIDIPPGWTHSIQNVGASEMIVLFWASEVFDADRPDTYPAEV
jgi:UDP-2-acetamido-2,6-beta-L-arabino-hexul-4-ose reductase